MALSKLCDICRKPNKIVGKLLFVPNGPKRTGSDYTHHSDVCDLCWKKFSEAFNFQKRKTREEYQASRKVASRGN